jgi:hypothetical protein
MAVSVQSMDQSLFTCSIDFVFGPTQVRTVVNYESHGHVDRYEGNP